MDVILQKHAHGCCAAALAMVTGQTYDEVAAAYTEDLSMRGLSQFHMEHYLVEHGYCWAKKTLYDPNNKKRAAWPPAPFGNIHICEVAMSGGSHAVVMLADGMVLDPMTTEVKRLTDYEEVYYAAAVRKLSD